MDFSKSSLLGISGVVVGILGVVGPIGWDYYKTRSELEFRLLESSVVIERPQKLAGLVVTYAGEEVQELSKALIAVTNTGRTPILKKDIVQPLSLRFTPESKLIDARIESSTPRDLGATLSLNRSDGSINLDVPLLNPGDQVHVSALAKSVKPDFDVNGRVVGVGSLTVIKGLPATTVAKATPWTVYPVGFFSLLLLGVSLFALLTHVPAELRAKKALRRKIFQMPALNSKGECLAWIDSHFFFTTSDERRPVKDAIAQLPDVPNFTTVHNQPLMNAVEMLVGNALSNVTVFFIIVAISAVGVWYVAANI